MRSSAPEQRDACPRCGHEPWPPSRCPECGYEPDHPGVLGAYQHALTRLGQHPLLLAPFLLPALLLALTQLALAAYTDPAADVTPTSAAATLTGLILVVTTYFTAVGSTARGAAPTPRWPTAAILLASLTGTILTLTPWALVGLILALQSQATLGGWALLAVVALMLASVLLAGRTIGFPIEAANHSRFTLETARQANQRAQEMGGLGLAFLGIVLFLAINLVPALIDAVLGLGLASTTLLAASSGLLWITGAWIGIAWTLGLQAPTDTARTLVECPACGNQAHIQQGRARCGCGLEGPYYEAGTQPG